MRVRARQMCVCARSSDVMLNVESGVSDKQDIQNVQGRGACRTGLKTTDLNYKMDLVDAI